MSAVRSIQMLPSVPTDITTKELVALIRAERRSPVWGGYAWQVAATDEGASALVSDGSFRIAAACTDDQGLTRCWDMRVTQP